MITTALGFALLIYIVIPHFLVQYELVETTFTSWEGYKSSIAVWRNGVFIEVMAVTLADFFIGG